MTDVATEGVGTEAETDDVPEITNQDVLEEVAKKQFFDPGMKQSALPFLNRLSEQQLVPFYMLETTEDEPWPKDAGLVILPIKKAVPTDPSPQAKKQQKTIAVLAWPYWPVSAFVELPAEADKRAAEYIADLVLESQVRTIMQPLGKYKDKPNDIGEVLPTLPTSIAQHLAASEGARGALKAWNAVIGGVVVSLKERFPALKGLNAQLVRRFCENAREAEAFDRRCEVELKLWERVINIVIDLGRKKGLDTSHIEGWLTSRYEEHAELEISEEELEAMGF